jgi:hypothetical protein
LTAETASDGSFFTEDREHPQKVAADESSAVTRKSTPDTAEVYAQITQPLDAKAIKIAEQCDQVHRGISGEAINPADSSEEQAESRKGKRLPYVIL